MKTIQLSLILMIMITLPSYSILALQAPVPDDSSKKLNSITVYEPTSSTIWDCLDTSSKSIRFSSNDNGVDVYLYKGSQLMQSFGYFRKYVTAGQVVLSTSLPSATNYWIKVEEWGQFYPEIGTSDYFKIVRVGSGET